MNQSYFTPQKAMGRFFYISGLTGDSFYSESGQQEDIEWLVYQELKRNGYERIVFYDRDWKLYCYDDMSFQLLQKGKKAKEEALEASSMKSEKNSQASTGKKGRRKKGLKMGGWEMDDQKEDTPHEEEPREEKTEESKLHSGIMDNVMVYRQIDACMRDGDIKTAIVINDASDFLSELGEEKEHSMDVYTKLEPSNENIIVYIYPDQKTIPILSMHHSIQEGKCQNTQDARAKEMERLANIIEITPPNALELKRMLNYFRLRMGLLITVKDMEEVALEIRRYMMEREPKVRVKELYHYLKNMAEQKKKLTKDNCHELFGASKHLTGEERLNGLIGMENVKKELLRFKGGAVDGKERVKYLSPVRIRPDLPVPERNDMMHILLTGHSGVGKTTVAKIMGQLYYEMGYLDTGHVVEVDREGLVAGYVGQTAIRTREKVKEALGGVLFIDEAYALAKGEEDHVDFGQEAIDTLVKAMDEFKGRFILIAAGYDEEMERFVKSNSGLPSRFRMKIHIDDYTPEEMEQILRLYMEQNGCCFTPELEEKMDEFCENWVTSAGDEWGNAREVATLAVDLKSYWESDLDRKTVFRDGKELALIEERHIPEDLRCHLVPAGQSREEALKQLKNLIGLKNVKKQIERIRKKMIAGDEKMAGHYLFVGNPGTGKTTVARILGRILKNLGVLRRGHVVEYTAGDLVAAVQRAVSHGKTLESVVKKALGGILFIDEAYQLLETNMGQKIISDLVPYMENNRDRLCIICAGYEDDMKKFLEHNVGLNGRFTEIIRFDNYSAGELAEILKSMLEGAGYEAAEEYLVKSEQALYGYLAAKGGAKDFANARYLRDQYIPHSIDAKNDRLFAMYGEDIPEEEKKKLTGTDIPVELKKYAKKQTVKKEKEIKTAMEEVGSMVGFEEIKEVFEELLLLGKAGQEEGMEDLLDSLNLHWMLKGGPGTGKTTVAKCLGRVYKEIGFLERGHLIKVTRGDLVGRYIGHTAQITKEWIEKAMGGVLFVDEAYMLKQSEDTGNDFGQEAIDTIMEAMSDRKGEFAVVFAGYPKRMDVFAASNPGLLSRMENNIYTLEDYTDEELSAIFEKQCHDRNFRMTEELKEDLPRLFGLMKKKKQAKGEDWANGRESENLEEKMRRRWVKDRTFVEEDGVKIRVYDKKHLPEDLKAFLEWDKKDGNPDLEKEKREDILSCSVKRELFATVEDNFSYEDSFEEKERGLVMIRANIGPVEKNQISTGSGSLITSEGHILTCNHVIRGCSKIKVRLRIPGLKAVMWLDAQVLKADEKLDAAILKVDVQGFPALPMREAKRDTKVGEGVFHLGYPFGVKLSDHEDCVEPSLFQGHVSSLQTKNGMKRINVDMAAKRGCSGGPVFSKTDGSIIGILCGSQTEGDARLMEEINYVLPASYIWEEMLRVEE